MLRADVEVDLPEFRLSVRLDVPPGVTVLFGPSGSGKSTLVRAMTGIAPLASDFLSLDGEVLIDTARGIRVPVHRRGLGVVFQDSALFPHMTVRRNLLYGAGPQGEAQLGRLAETFEIAGLLSRYPGRLSGGQRQRVALARSLLARPRALLLDEPLSALDLALAARVRDHVLDLAQERRLPCIWITHSIDEVLAVADRVAILAEGELLQEATLADAVNRPATEAVRASFSAHCLARPVRHVRGSTTAASAGLAPVESLEASTLV